MSFCSKRIYYLLSFILLMITLFILIGLKSILDYRSEIICHDHRSPIKTLEVKIDIDKQNQLVDLLQKFSDENSFAFYANHYPKNGEAFLVDLKSRDVEIIARNPFDRSEVLVGFYNNNCAQPKAASDVQDLYNKFKASVLQIPSADIIEER